jgi:cell pole-organizing protein PopZ
VAENATPPAAGEPSMDDILASIRKILNEEEGTPAEASSAPAAPPAEQPLDLTADMMVASEPVAAPVSAAPPPPAPAPALEDFAEGLVAPAAAAAAAAAVGQLSRTVAQDRLAGVVRGSGLTLEDVVREELRPLLKAWLDAHLPPMVERIVREEIERVVARAR